MSVTLRKTWHAVRSPRLTASLLGTLIAFVVIGFVIPQRNALTAEEFIAWQADYPAISRWIIAAGLHAAFTSLAFQLVVAVLAMNLIACTVHRLSHRRSYPPRASSAIPDSACALETRDAALDDVAGAVAASGGWWCRSAPDSETRVLWLGQWGWRGSMLLHVGLILLVLGGLLSSLTRFSGVMVLTEGQSVQDSPEAYVTVDSLPRLGRPFTGETISLDSIRFTYEADTVTEVVARMRAGSSAHDARVNYPLHHAGKAYLVSEAGHAVAIRVTDTAGKVVQSIVNLGDSRPDGSSDEIDIDGRQLLVRLVSDAALQDANDVRRLELNDPVLMISTPADASVSALVLRPGDAGRLGELDVEFTDVRLWNRFLVRADSGRWVTYMAFLCIVVGMAVRLLDPDVTVFARMREGRIHLWARARTGRVLEQRLIERIQRAFDDRPTEGARG